MNTATPTPPNAHTMQADYRLIKVGVLGFFPDPTTVPIGVAGVDVDRCADRNGDAEGKGQPSNDRRHTDEERHADDQRYADHDQCNEVYSTTHQAAFRSREGQSGEMHARTAESPVNRQREQCETTITGISAYSGSVTAKPATDLPPISITTDGAAATRALISKGRVSSMLGSLLLIYRAIVDSHESQKLVGIPQRKRPAFPHASNERCFTHGIAAKSGDRHCMVRKELLNLREKVLIADHLHEVGYVTN